MQLSVIIPTYNRGHTLRQCLEYLQKQTMRDFEVIIVDDGSTDDTKTIIENFNQSSWLQIKYIYQTNQKQGIARNLGIQNASSEIILFLGDDIFPLPSLIEEHLAIHQTFPEENIAVLGHTTWDPFLPINAYMRFLEWSGWQFNYHQIQSLKPYTAFPAYKDFDHNGKFLPTKQQHWFFYTSNLSLKKSLLLQEPFSEKFIDYGWEDIELGLRLTQKYALQVFYNRNAKAYHHHLQHENELESKIQGLAKGLQYAPELKPSKWKITLFNLVLSFLSLIPLNYQWTLWIKAKKIFYETLSKPNA